MVAVSNIMVTICIMFSVPILHYPCRFSLWNLLHQMIPRFVPAAFDNGDPRQDFKSCFQLEKILRENHRATEFCWKYLSAKKS